MPAAIVASRVRARREEARKRANEERRKQLTELFNKYDKDKTGKLTPEEVGAMLQEQSGEPATKEELAFVMKMSDTKAPKGALGVEEFANAINCWQCYVNEFDSPESFGSTIFSKYDTDGTGKLDRTQLRNFLNEMNDGREVSTIDLEWVLTKADVLGDGQVNKIELSMAVAAWFQKKAEQDIEEEEKARAKSSVCTLL